MKTKLKKLRSNLMTALVEKTKDAYIRFFNKKRKGWHISIEQLKQYPKNSLGKDLADFLVQENFDLIAGMESHDVYHLVLEYSTKVEDEAKMQFFLLGNGKKSPYAIGTSIIAFLVIPDQWLAFWNAYNRGKKSLKVYLWDSRFLLKEKTTVLRALVNRQKQSNFINL